MRLAEVVGQRAACTLAGRLAARGRLPHALLIEGPPGCGRRTFAVAIAQALLCGAPVAGDACGLCDRCRLVPAGTHPDLVLAPNDNEPDHPWGADYDADVARALPVQLVRERLVEPAFQSPLLGGAKAIVIPAIERLRDEAANALLKVLEEPPPGTYLLMTTAAAGAVLGTIRSRAQLIRLQPLSATDLALVLERGGLPRPTAAARAAGGGSHRGCWDGGEPPAPLPDLLALVDGGLDAGRVAAVMAALEAARGGDDTPAAGQRRLCRAWLDALIAGLRVRLREDPDAARVETIERVLAAQRDLQRNLQPRLVLEGLAAGR